MAILPVDLQALLVRLGDASKPHQREYEGAILTQMTRAEEVARAAEIESRRVNEVKPHPDLNNRIEPESRGKGSQERKRGEEKPPRTPGAAAPSAAPAAVEHPYKGRIIDTKV